MIAYINKTIPIPNVTEQDINRKYLGDADYTGLGAYRVDRVAVKKIWEFKAEYLTKEEYDAIVNYLDNYGVTYFWYDEIGGNATDNSIEAVIEITRDKRVKFYKDGVFHNNGRTIELEVREQ